MSETNTDYVESPLYFFSLKRNQFFRPRFKFEDKNLLVQPGSSFIRDQHVISQHVSVI